MTKIKYLESFLKFDLDHQYVESVQFLAGVHLLSNATTTLCRNKKFSICQRHALRFKLPLNISKVNIKLLSHLIYRYAEDSRIRTDFAIWTTLAPEVKKSSAIVVAVVSVMEVSC